MTHPPHPRATRNRRDISHPPPIVSSFFLSPPAILDSTIDLLALPNSQDSSFDNNIIWLRLVSTLPRACLGRAAALQGNVATPNHPQHPSHRQSTWSIRRLVVSSLPHHQLWPLDDPAIIPPSPVDASSDFKLYTTTLHHLSLVSPTLLFTFTPPSETTAPSRIHCLLKLSTTATSLQTYNSSAPLNSSTPCQPHRIPCPCDKAKAKASTRPVPLPHHDHPITTTRRPPRGPLPRRDTSTHPRLPLARRRRRRRPSRRASTPSHPSNGSAKSEKGRGPNAEEGLLVLPLSGALGRLSRLRCSPRGDHPRLGCRARSISQLSCGLVQGGIRVCRARNRVESVWRMPVISSRVSTSTREAARGDSC